jgi:hypothetical protein
MSPFARAHSSTNATSQSAATRRTWGVDTGDDGQPLEREPADGQGRLEPVDQGDQAGLHVGHPGPRRDTAREPERTLSHRPDREDGVGVPDEQRAWTARLAREDRFDRVAEPAGRVGMPGDRAAEPREAIGCPGGDQVHSVAGVAAGVEVDEVLELGEQVRL